MTASSLRHKTLASYLNQHLVGSEYGVTVFKAIYTAWRGTEHEQAFYALYKSVHTDHEDLIDIIAELKATPTRIQKLKSLPLRIALKAGFPMPKARDHDRSAQMAFDILLGMVNAKLSMWEPMDALPELDRRIPGETLAQLIRRNHEQIDELKRLRDQTSGERFAK